MRGLARARRASRVSVRTRTLARILAVLALSVACGEGTSPPPAVATVSIDPKAVDVVPGATNMLVAVAKDATGSTLIDRPTVWSSSDETKVTVAGGLVTGVAYGTATVTASVEGRTASVEVRVKDGAIVGNSGHAFSTQSGSVRVAVPAGALAQTISLTISPATNLPASARLLSGSAFDFGPAATAFAQPVAIVIKYDPALVTAGNSESELMLYEVVSGGWRVVEGSTANTNEKLVTGSVTRLGTYAVMMMPRVETVTIGGDLSPVPVVTNRQLNVTLKDNEGTTLNRATTWSSSDPAILSIDPATGLASAKKPGSVTVTATSEGKSGTATVTVIPGPPAKLIAFAGNNQSVAAGGAVPTAPSVLVTDAGDNPIANVPVTFAITAGGGTITGASATTNAAGIAAVGSWTLGTAAGPNTLVATSTAVSGVTITFQAAAGAGPAAKVEAVAGNNQNATAGGLVGTKPSVKVTDANGNFVAGFTVTFAPASGSGTVTGGSAVTDGSGIATVGSWRLGTTPGAQSLIATAAGLAGSPITFSATAVAPVPSKVEGWAGNNQSARPGFNVSTPPSVRVTDAEGIPVPGYLITWVVTGGGGSITGESVVTNADGIAAVGSWKLGPQPGNNSLNAGAGTLTGSPVVFNATGAAPPATTVAIHAGGSQTALAGQPVPVNPAVKVTDAEGFGVPGVTVVFSIRSGDGTISGASAVSDASGIATIGSWVLGLGGNSLFATANGLTNSPLVFVALGTAEVQMVTFGDSNTDLGFQGTDTSPKVASYVSSANPAIKLNSGQPVSPLQLAGKIEARWRANRTKTIKVVNHGISGTSTGSGRTILFAPNALEQVGGITRFRGEVLGDAYPWSGGEPVNEFYPTGPVQRVQAFTPRTSDFAYISMGTNDVASGIPTIVTRNNLEIMIDEWIGRGLPANRFFLTTLPPRRPGAESANIPDLNNKIRALAAAKGVRLIDIAAFVSNDNGLTWKSSSMHVVNDQLHYSEAVRDWIADQVVSVMLALNP